MRLIDADALFGRGAIVFPVEHYESVQKIVDMIRNAPTITAEPTYEQVEEYCRKRCLVVIDAETFAKVRATWSAEPVKHGRWIDDGDSILHCTSCHRYIRRIVPVGYDYCPHCGARMDGGENDK